MLARKMGSNAMTENNPPSNKDSTVTTPDETEFPETGIFEAETIDTDTVATETIGTDTFATENIDTRVFDTRKFPAAPRLPATAGPQAAPAPQAVPGPQVVPSYAPMSTPSAPSDSQRGPSAPLRVGLLIWSVILVLFGLLVLIGGSGAPISLQGLVTTLLALAGIAFIVLAVIQKQKRD